MRNGALKYADSAGDFSGYRGYYSGLVIIFLGCDYMIRYYINHVRLERRKLA